MNSQRVKNWMAYQLAMTKIGTCNSSKYGDLRNKILEAKCFDLVGAWFLIILIIIIILYIKATWVLFSVSVKLPGPLCQVHTSYYW